MDKISKVLLVTVAVLTPLLYVTSYAKQYGLLYELGLSNTIYAYNFHEHIVRGALYYLDKLGFLGAIFVVTIPFFIITIVFLYGITLLPRGMARSSYKFWGAIKYYFSRNLSSKQMELFLDGFVAIKLLTIFFMGIIIFGLLFSLLIAIPYQQGVSSAIDYREEIEEDEEFLDEEKLTTVCMENKIKVKGRLLVNSPTHFAIYSMGRVHEFQYSSDIMLIRNDW